MSNQFTTKGNLISSEIESKRPKITELFSQQYSVAEISKITAIGYSSLYKKMCSWGLNTSRKTKPISRTHRSVLDKKNKIAVEDLRELYTNRKMTMAQIGVIYNTTSATILSYLRKFNIERRNKSEAMRLIYVKNPEKREYYRQMCYNGIIGIFKKSSYKNSWIETAFAEYCNQKNISYEVQYQIRDKGHHYDFKIGNLLIETDGIYWHDTDKQKLLDNRHETLAISSGYDIIRFTDHEIRNSKGKCFERIDEFVCRSTDHPSEGAEESYLTIR